MSCDEAMSRRAGGHQPRQCPWTSAAAGTREYGLSLCDHRLGGPTRRREAVWASTSETAPCLAVGQRVPSRWPMTAAAVLRCRVNCLRNGSPLESTSSSTHEVGPTLIGAHAFARSCTQHFMTSAAYQRGRESDELAALSRRLREQANQQQNAATNVTPSAARVRNNIYLHCPVLLPP